MTYETYAGLSREVLLEKVQSVMSDKRFKHVLGVEKAAIHLAELNGYDTEKAGLAGLLHDYAKEVPDQTFLDLIDKYQLDPELKTGTIMSGMAWWVFTKSKRIWVSPTRKSCTALKRIPSAALTCRS